MGHQQLGRAQARAGDLLHAQGCMLFWAEGSRSKNAVTFVNSDVNMMRLFLRFLRECYGVRDEAITLSCNCFPNNGLSLAQIEAYWMERLGLPPTSLRQASVNRLSSASGGTKRTLPYGTARLAVHSTRIVQSLYGAIQEYGGFECPDWLDCRPGRHG